MNEHASELALSRYLDDETTAAESTAIRQHLANCAACALAVAERARMKRAVRLAGERYAPEPAFRKNIEAMVAPPKRRISWTWKPFALGTLATLLLALGLFLAQASRSSNGEISEAIDLHVSALASQNPVDVVSTDRHTVKPWFQGRLPFSFNLPEVAGTPFVLEGGRMVYVRQQPCAQLIYGLRQHRISVFACSGENRHLRDVETPFRALSWSGGGLHYFAVTDTDMSDLKTLESMWRKANAD